MSKLLEGKRCLITGASSGIGRACACAFAREGAHLILIAEPSTKDECDSVAQQCKSEGASSVECIAADLSNLDHLHSEVCTKINDVDVLVNNAGIFPSEHEDPLKGDIKMWKRTMELNLLAPMALTKHFASQMASKGEGYIVNIGDVEGSHTGPRHPAYAASKHALRGWSLSCYELLRDRNIKVCLINPGNVADTKMLEEQGKGEGQGRIAPDDVAQAALFMFKLSKNCVPSEMELKAVRSNGTSAMA